MKKVCQNCKKEFIFCARTGVGWAEKTGRGKFCSMSCYRESRKGKRVSLKTEFKKGVAGDKHVCWKGGREITKLGYVKIYNPKHPKAHKGKVFEHRLVVEALLGRYLKKEEVIHHIDGNKQNNSISNLMLFSSHSQHMKYERNNK